MAGPFLGVELPSQFPTESAPEVSPATHEATDKAPEVAKEPSTPDDPTVDKPAPAAKPDLVDLDKLERFRFQGRELTPKELLDRQMMREDYTRKLQAVSEARKYADNFQTDLAWVLEDPTRLGKMKEVYPREYVKIAEQILSRVPTEPGKVTPETAQTSTPALPPEYVQTIEELRDWKATVQAQIDEAKAQKADAELTAWFDDFGKKYSDAAVDVVTAKAEMLAGMLQDQGKEFTKGHLEKLFKEDHDLRAKAIAERIRAQQKEQKAVAKKSLDIGGGGGVAGQAPKQAKTFKEASALLESDLKAGRLS